MRIALDVQWITNQATGIGKITLNWIRELAKIDSENEYLLVGKGQQNSALIAAINGCSNFSYLDVPPLQLRGFAYSFTTLYWDQVRLPIRLKRQEYDLLHLMWFNIPAVHAKPFILTIHDLDNIIRAYNYSLKFKLYYNKLLTFFVPRAATIITVSYASKRDIIKYFQIPSERVHVIYHGVNGIFRPLTEKNDLLEIQTKYGIQGKYILNTGGIGLRKNLKRLLEAFALVCRGTHLDLSLIITGVGAKDMLMQLQDYTKYLQIAKQVLFVGYVPEQDMPKLYCGALALVYPSLFEGFGLPIIEAMACGTPMVTSNVSSMPEIAGGAAILVDPLQVEDIARGIIQICEDSYLREQLRDRGMERARHFRWESAANNLLTIYSNINSCKR